MLLLIITGVLVYCNSFHGAFVFDDISYITKNDPNVHMSEFSWNALKKAAVEGKPRHRYLPNISFALNYLFSGENTFGYHLTNLGIHLLTGIFLFFLFRTTLQLCMQQEEDRYSGGRLLSSLSVSPELLSFFAVLLWVVHPVQTNAVTYIVQRMASMVALFFVLSLLCYVTGRVRMREEKIKTAGLYFFGCFVLGCCAVGTKENAGTLPVMILVYEFFFFQKRNIFHSSRTCIWMIAGGVVFAIIAIHFMGADPFQRILSSYSRREFTLPQRVMTEFRVVVYYLSLLFFPHPRRLILDHDYPLSHAFTNPLTTLSSFAAIAAVAGIAVYLFKKDRLLSFALVWLLGNLVIESSVIGIEIIYEHRMYLPFAFLFLIILIQVFYRFKNSRAAVWGLIVCVIILTGWSHDRNRIWQTDVSFWTDSILKAPQKARPYQNLAYSFQERGELGDALAYYKKSVEIKPHSMVYFNMGLCLDGIGYYHDAADAYSSALNLNHNTPRLHAVLARALARTGEFQAAAEHFATALEMKPSDFFLQQKLSALQAFLDHHKDPEKQMLAAIAKDQDNPALWYKLATIYETGGKTDQAFTAYETIFEKIQNQDRKLRMLVANRMAAISR